MVIPYIYGTHRNPAHWQDVESFDPRRFEPDRRKARHPFAYIPFGGGPRICIGNNMAMMQMLMIVVAFVRNYDFALTNDEAVRHSTDDAAAAARRRHHDVSRRRVSMGALDARLERWMSDADGRLRKPRFAVVLAVCYVLFTATYVSINVFSVGRDAAHAVPAGRGAAAVSADLRIPVRPHVFHRRPAHRHGPRLRHVSAPGCAPPA